MRTRRRIDCLSKWKNRKSNKSLDGSATGEGVYVSIQRCSIPRASFGL